MRNKKLAYYFLGLILLAVLITTEVKFIHLYQMAKKIETFQKMEVSEEVLDQLEKRYRYGSQSFFQKLTEEMFCNEFSLLKKNQIKSMNIGFYQHFMKKLWKQYEEQYQIVCKDLNYFPVKEDIQGKETFFFDNSWMGSRNFGGKRFHEGCDIMSSNNKRGYFSIVSMTDGVIEQMGWLEKGGYRIGIRSPSGGYYYYAHLYQYADGLKKGDMVKAGQVIGQMGDSGYSKTEGTVGNFDVHLHLGIYLTIDGKETSVNPYYLLTYLKKKT